MFTNPTIYYRGKNAYLNWTKNGKRFRVSLGPISAEEAETVRIAKMLELRSGNESILNINTATPTILNDVYEEYINWYAIKYPDNFNRMESMFRVHLIPFFGKQIITDINHQLMSKYELMRTKSNAKLRTIGHEITAAKAFLNRMVEWNYLKDNPLKKYKIPNSRDSKAIRFYTKEELDSIYCFAPYNWHLWKFMTNTGIRRKEAIKAKWSDIRNGYLFIESTEKARTKSGKWRKIPLNKEAKLALKRFKKDKKDVYIFPRMNENSLSRAFQRVVNRSGIDKPVGSLHSLRHTFITQLIIKGVHLRVVQRLAGHASIATTENYAHVVDELLDSATLDLDL